jgi:putative flippase GtrA
MKINKEVLNYIVFGILTTLINIVVYFFLTKAFSINYQFATVTAWIVAVLFAYYTNKKFVFKTNHSLLIQTIKSLLLFIYYRILSLVIDIGIMYLLIEVLYFDDLLSKVIANVIVVIFNYITSKLFVFRQRGLESK